MQATRQGIADRNLDIVPINAVSRYTSGLVGREAEFAELRHRVTSPDIRILTVTGPVGVGKSRLAAAVFDDAIGEFTHGGRHLDIDEWCDRGDVTETLLAVLGLGVSLDPREARERLTGHLRTRHFLLALDGCHHRRAHLTPLISHLVKECPGLTVLVTGPDRLGVYGEVLLRLDPLAVPRADDTYTIATLQRIPSVRLFVQRTRMVRPRFVLTDDNLDAVARLCVRTDGLPMAVEFAAARMKLLSPQRLLTELDEGLDSLSGAEFDTLTQHSGMPAALDHGLLGLTPGERSFLDRLALFHNEFEFSAAQGVSATPPGETHRLLEILVDKSLLRTRECPDGDVLITMLGLTRQHLVERMRADGTLTAVEREHATYCLKLAEESENGLRGSSQGRWLQQIDHWLPDITAALAHLAAAGDRERIVRIASALRLYWQARGTVYDGIAWLSGHENAGLPPEVAAKGERALAELLLCGGELSAAGERLARARALYEHLEDGSGIAGCLRRAGLIAYYRGDLVEAERRFDECVSLDRVDDAGEHAEALRNLADCRRVAGDPLSARSLAEESLRLFERAGDVRNIALTDYVRADIAFALGEQETAAELYQSALLRVAALKHTAATAIGLEKFAILLTRSRGRATESWRRAARSFGAAARIRAAAGCVAPATTKMEVDSVVATTRVRLGDQEALELAAAGARMEPDVAIAAALTPLDIARTARDGIDRDNPLTQREQEVAELVAAGLTNREIARRLGIAEWTAVNHLRKIMRKLSCSSRVQVASWVANRAEAVAVAE